MTRDRYDLVMHHCADLGIDVEWAPLGDHRRGEYHRDGDRIVLNRALTRRQVTATLSHELGHHRFGHGCSTPANERRAWRYGAALIVAPHEYRRAESLVGHQAAAIALELDVTPQLIQAWRDWWLSRGQFLGRRTEQAT